VSDPFYFKQGPGSRSELVIPTAINIPQVTRSLFSRKDGRRVC